MLKFATGIFPRALPPIALAFLLVACGDSEWQSLDRRQSEDVVADADDFMVYPETQISYRRSYHPEVWEKRWQSGAGGSLEEFEEARSKAETPLLEQRLERYGFTRVNVVSDVVANDGKNILLTVNFTPGRGDKLYSVTFTARQGNLYYEEARSPTSARVSVDFAEPLDAESIRDVNVAESMGLDSHDMVTSFLKMLSAANDIEESQT